MGRSGDGARPGGLEHGNKQTLFSLQSNSQPLKATDRTLFVGSFSFSPDNVCIQNPSSEAVKLLSLVEEAQPSGEGKVSHPLYRRGRKEDWRPRSGKQQGLKILPRCLLERRLAPYGSPFLEMTSTCM